MYQFDYIKNRINLCIISSSLGNKQFCGGLLENFWKLIFLEIFDTCDMSGFISTCAGRSAYTGGTISTLGHGSSIFLSGGAKKNFRGGLI